MKLFLLILLYGIAISSIADLVPFRGKYKALCIAFWLLVIAGGSGIFYFFH